MKKIKGLLVAFVALFVFALAMVTGNAAADHGKEAGFDYVVSTTTTENDTATYDILPNEQVILAVGDTIMGKIVWEKKNSAKFTTTNASLKVGDQWIIPVPTGSAGTVEISATSTSAGRSYALLDGSEAQIKTVECAKPAEITFTSGDIVTVNGGSYLRFGVVGGELKPTGIKIILTTGAFAATAQRYTVSYLVPGEAEAYATEDVEGGETAVGKPAKWGYDLKGLYTDAELTTPWNKVVTGACNVYCDLEAWDASVLGDGNKLTPEIIAKGAELLPIDANGTQVPGTIFTILGSVSYADTTLSVNGVQASKVLNTGGAFSTAAYTRGLAFNASKAGKIALYLHGNNAARTITLYSTKEVEGKVTSDEVLDTESVIATKDEAILVEFDIAGPGEYAIGGDGTTHIFSAEFVSAPEPSVSFYQQSGYNADGVELVRYIGIVENIAEADIPGSFSLVITGANIPGGSFDATSLCVIANRITSNGETYVAEINGANYEFGVKNNVLYVVCVLAVSNDGAALTDQYVGTELTATLTVNGGQIGVKTYTVLGAQA